MGSPEEQDDVDELTARFIAEEKASKLGPRKRRWLRLPRLTRRKLVILLPILLLASVVAGQELYNYYGPGTCHSLTGARSVPAATKVGLIDTLAYEYPDRGFVQQIESSSKAAGLGFDYYTPNTISLDTFVHLPVDGYSILILRTHIGYSNTTTTALQVAITTSEPYDNYRWVTDQTSERLTDVNVNGSYYFGLTPLFVSERMCGNFPGTLVLAMGCYGMNNTSVGDAFIQKGAGGFIGWKGVVRVSETDTAFEKLVPLLLQGTSVSQAVREVMSTREILLGSPILSYLPN